MKQAVNVGAVQRSAEGGLYRYESVLSGFNAKLQLDADGLVVEYPGIFRRVWPQER